MECCRNSDRPIPNYWMSRLSMRSRSSILASFDEHFKWYSWYAGSATFTEGFGFQFVYNSDAAEILNATHIINEKPVGIGRIVFVGGLPRNMEADKFRSFFSKFGKVERCEIVERELSEAGFGLIVFDSEKTADELSARGIVELDDCQVTVKKAKLFRAFNSDALPMVRQCLSLEVLDLLNETHRVDFDAQNAPVLARGGNLMRRRQAYDFEDFGIYRERVLAGPHACNLVPTAKRFKIKGYVDNTDYGFNKDGKFMYNGSRFIGRSSTFNSYLHSSLR